MLPAPHKEERRAEVEIDEGGGGAGMDAGLTKVGEQ